MKNDLFKNKKVILASIIALIMIVSAIIIYTQNQRVKFEKHQDYFFLHLQALEKTKQKNKTFYESKKKEVEAINFNAYDTSIHDIDTSIKTDIETFHQQKQAILNLIDEQQEKQSIIDKKNVLTQLKDTINQKVVNAQQAKTIAEEAAKQEAERQQREKEENNASSRSSSATTETPNASTPSVPSVPSPSPSFESPWTGGCSSMGNCSTGGTGGGSVGSGW